MFVFTPATIALCVTIPLCAYFIAKWLFQKDTEAENRKRSAIKVSNALTAMGLKRLPRVLEAYAVSDWSGLANDLKTFSELALDEKAIVEEFDGVFKNVLSKKLATAEGRAYVTAMVNDATAV